MNTGQSLRDMLKFGSTAFAGILALDQGFFGQRGMAAPAQHGVFEGTYEKGEYRLPALPYDYDALEPLYDEKTLRIHHDKHHAAYVKGLNEALQKLAAARQANDYSSIQGRSLQTAFNGSGHVLHTLFWHSMSPERPSMPAGFVEALNDSFGSEQNARSQFAAATKVAAGASLSTSPCPTSS
jgi:hypothetical protein